MKTATFILAFTLVTVSAGAQYESIFHPSTFTKFKGVMRSNPYKPSDDEKKFRESFARNVYPTEVKMNPKTYVDSSVHWIGIVKEVIINDSGNKSNVLFTLDQKYWDYIEDYSIQDEVMFVSPLGEGHFYLLVQLELNNDEKEKLKKMPDEQTLFLCYGNVLNSDSIPALKASYIKIVDYKYYSTKIFSYKIKRNADGKLVKDKSGNTEMDEFKMLKVARRGQNK